MRLVTFSSFRLAESVISHKYARCCLFKFKVVFTCPYQRVLTQPQSRLLSAWMALYICKCDTFSVHAYFVVTHVISLSDRTLLYSVFHLNVGLMFVCYKWRLILTISMEILLFVIRSHGMSMCWVITISVLKSHKIKCQMV